MDLILHWVIGIELVIPFFQSEFDAQQLLVNRFGEIPPSGDFGDFLWLLWLFYFDGRNRMNSLSTGMNSICPGESEMVCHIHVHSKSENESCNEPCTRNSKVCLVSASNFGFFILAFLLKNQVVWS